MKQTKAYHDDKEEYYNNKAKEGHERFKYMFKYILPILLVCIVVKLFFF